MRLEDAIDRLRRHLSVLQPTYKLGRAELEMILKLLEEIQDEKGI